MLSSGSIELRVADHVPGARARQFLRAAGAPEAPAGSNAGTAVITALFALTIDRPVVEQCRRIIDASPLPLVVAVADALAPDCAEMVEELLWMGVWNIAAQPDDARLTEDLRRCAESMQHVERVLHSEMVRKNLVGSSRVWRSLLRELIWVARYSCAPVLLLGETGTGKELLARLIHTTDGRSDKGELVVVDCTTLGSELAGSELFGHERGAYTGAHAQRPGVAQLANGGTLFLDEVGELHPTVQAQLLRLLQEGSYKTVGGNAWQRSSFRLVCATHRDLSEAVAAGRFRQDLYFRIAGWVSHVPALRERPGDVRELADGFLAEFGCPQSIDALVEHVLVRHRFPGNVRELRQLMMQAAVKHCGAHCVSLGDMPCSWHAPRRPESRIPPGVDGERAPSVADQGISQWVRAGAGLREITQRAGDLAVQEALLVEGNHVGRAARRLGITERAIQLRKAQRPTPLQVETRPKPLQRG